MKNININTKKESHSSIFRIILYIFLIVFLTIASLIASLFVKRDLSVRNLDEIYSIFRSNNLEYILPFKQYDIAFEKGIDELSRTEITKSLDIMENDSLKRFNIVNESEYMIEAQYIEDSKEDLGNTYLVFVGHPYWISDGIRKSDLGKYKFVVKREEGEYISKIIKQYTKNENVSIVPSDDIQATLLKNEGKMLGVIGYRDLNDKLKLLELDGKYFLEDLSGGIKVSYTITDNVPEHIISAAYKNSDVIDEITRDDILKINMTGVTAISRRLGLATKNSGDNSYGATKIYKFLSDADFVHTSNEVSFVTGCVPDPATMRFCAVLGHIETLKKLGINIVELTGNHNNDFGATSSASTIETYKKLGWSYYGGGLNETDAAKPLVKDIKGSKVGFLGYNYYDTMQGTGALASATRSGANSFSFEKMEKEIKELKKTVGTVIVTFQFQECYSYPEHGGIYPICYKPLSSPDQKQVFRSAVDYGADIVIGSQAHQPQTFEIYKDKMIYYGLGNLLFDQTPWIGTRQGLVLSHYVLNGKILQTRISTTYYDSDLKPYVTYGKDRELLLNLLKDAR